MRRSTVRDVILGVAGSFGFLTTVVLFDLGCTGSSDDNKGAVATVEISPAAVSIPSKYCKSLGSPRRRSPDYWQTTL